MENEISKNKKVNNKDRYFFLDIIRGCDLISMIVYHTIWDLVFVYHFDIPWYRGRIGFLWQQSICWIFILLSGFCWAFSKHKWRNGWKVFLAGMAISIVTILVVPEQRIIFGVLTLLGSCMLLLIPFQNVIKRIPPIPGAAISFFMFLIFRNINKGYVTILTCSGKISLTQRIISKKIYRGYLMSFLGFQDPSFFSTDYFSLLPWIFLYLTGIFLYYGWYYVWTKKQKKQQVCSRNHMEKGLDTKLALLTFPGRHSLLIYLLHQPVLTVILQLILK